MAVETHANGQTKLWKDLTPAEQRAATAATLNAKRAPGAINGKEKQIGQFDLIGYVRCELGRSDKEVFKAWEADQAPGATFDMAIKLCDSGYLLKCGQGKDGYQCVLSACDTNTGWDGYVLTAFGGDAQQAFALAMYKHYVLLNENWEESLGGTGKSGLR